VRLDARTGLGWLREQSGRSWSGFFAMGRLTMVSGVKAVAIVAGNTERSEA
jgi:hypothetical protein